MIGAAIKLIKDGAAGQVRWDVGIQGEVIQPTTAEQVSRRTARSGGTRTGEN